MKLKKQMLILGLVMVFNACDSVTLPDTIENNESDTSITVEEENNQTLESENNITNVEDDQNITNEDQENNVSIEDEDSDAIVDTEHNNTVIHFSNEQRLIADQFISIFENGTTKIQYDYAENIGDGRGITAGRAGFTSATGDMMIVIEKYTKIKPNNGLEKYIEELKKLETLRYEEGDKEGSASTDNLEGLIEAWKESCNDHDFIKVQDEVVDELYYLPALKKAKKLGLKYPLSLLSLYDTNIQHGENGLEALIKKTANNRSPKDGYDEIKWLREFNKHRKEELNKDSTWRDSIVRVEELVDLINDGNMQLKPFTMIIQKYDDEKHILPTIDNNGLVSQLEIHEEAKLDLKHFLAKGYALEKEDTGSAKNIEELKKKWGMPECIDETRVKMHNEGGDSHSDPFGKEIVNHGYYNIIMHNGENVSEYDNDDVERCELGINEWRSTKKYDWLDQSAFVLYREGDHKVTFFSMRLDENFPLDTKRTQWQSVMQMKQTQPSNNDGTPMLSLHVEDNQWKLFKSGSAGKSGYTKEIWSAPAKKEKWVRFAFDVVYSSDPQKGSIKVYVDLNGDGDANDNGEQSKVIKMSTLKYEIEGKHDYFKAGESIPSHLRVGPYHDSSIDCGGKGCLLGFDNLQIVIVDK